MAPIILVHGVGSAPGTWGVKVDKETVPDGQPNWPASDNSKTGGYYWHKAELDSVRKCEYQTSANQSERPLDILYKIRQVTGPDGEDLTSYTTGLALGWACDKTVAISNGQEFTTSSSSPTMASRFDWLQSATSLRSRRSDHEVEYWYRETAPTTPGTVIRNQYYPWWSHGPAPQAPDYDMPELGPRMNGIEVFDSYWTFGWPDGDVPGPLKGLTGMLYGTMLSSNNHKWVKARFSRHIDRILSPGGDEWTAFTPEEWWSINPTIEPTGALRDNVLGPYKSCSGRKHHYSTSSAAGKTTYEHGWSCSSNPLSLIANLVYTVNDKGYTGQSLPEETQHGQIGQLYIFIRKVLDKYYRDSNGNPNWYLGNGQSDPDAKVVLVGHSQGGVISRGVLYPGFSMDIEVENGYQPMYYPLNLAYQDYLTFAGTTANMGGVSFDVRKHVAGVVTISSPNYGSPIAYTLDGLHALHKQLVAMKQQKQGLYHSIWSRGFASLDGKTLGMAKNEINDLLVDVDPVNEALPTVGEGFNETIRNGLRKVNDYSNYKTHETFATPITGLEQGRLMWQMQTATNGMAPPSSPCEPVNFGTNEAPIRANHYRLYWQPEYDNWVRSFRLDEGNNGGFANERVHTVNGTLAFTTFGKVLCEEQVGRFTRITQINSSTLPSDLAEDKAYNPFSTNSASTNSALLAKISAAQAAAATAGEPSVEADIKALKDCAEDVAKKPLVLAGAFTSLFAAPIANPLLWAGGYEAYNAGRDCLNDFKVSLNQTVQGLFHAVLTNGAQGLAFHPASTFLHKLNQRGGFDSKAAERRPFPARPDGTPIPFINVVNNLTSNSFAMTANGPDVNGDLTVNTLSQDLGFGYPDVSKAGSLTKLSLTGVTHSMATNLRDTLYGPYWKRNAANSGWELDKVGNRSNGKVNRASLGNLIFGLAIGQSPVLANQGPAAAKIGEIQSAYTVLDPDGFVKQSNSKESVQGRYTRLKGLNQEDIREPVALPYASDRSGFRIDRPIVVRDSQELFIPAGSTVTFGPSGALIVKSGGRLTFGGVPTYSSASGDALSTRFVSLTALPPDVRVQNGALLKYPDRGASLLKYSLVQVLNGIQSAVHLSGSAAGTPVTLPSNHMYGRYDSKPYQEYRATRNAVWKDIAKMGLPPGILMLLLD